MDEKKAILVSVGGTPKPIAETIQHHKPSFVTFFVSQQTIVSACDIIRELKSNNVEFEYKFTISEDPDDLLHCYRKAEEAVDNILSKGFKNENVIVDYTGGTKNMSVALALASIKYGFSYSYVGGKERTKDGVGIVVDGTEEVKYSINPWDYLSLKEKDTFITLFNAYQYKSAKEIADAVTKKTSKYRALYRKLSLISEGFYRWDLFCHADAQRIFERAKIEEFSEYDDLWVRDFKNKLEYAVEKLKELVNYAGKPSLPMIYDLFSNAERRFEEGKIDDAILRLYRIVEMIAQYKLSEEYRIDTSDVKLEQIPESIKEEFVRKYEDNTEGKSKAKIKIPQHASFILLKELGDEVGKIYVQKEKEFKSIQTSRNSSYLAHGFQSSSEKTYEKLRDFVLSLGIIEKDKLWQFPKIITEKKTWI